MAIIDPNTNLYSRQILELPDKERDRAARIRIADRIYNLRAGEPNLETRKNRERLMKQLSSTIQFTLPICDLIDDEKQQVKYRDALLDAIVYTLMRLENAQERNEADSDERAALTNLWPALEVQHRNIRQESLQPTIMRIAGRIRAQFGEVLKEEEVPTDARWLAGLYQNGIESLPPLTHMPSQTHRGR